MIKKIICFGSIQNNIALKLKARRNAEDKCFGSIQNNIALKLPSRNRY